MKILLDFGHCLKGSDTGARGNGKLEQDCTREIGYKVKSKLEALGHTAVICTCDSSNSVIQSLEYRVNKANLSGGDLFVSIHLNAGGGVGTEIFTYGAKHFIEADRVLEKIVALGYANRGIKDGSKLFVIKNTNMKAMLIETCFIDTSDMYKYNADNFAKAITEGITGQKVIDIVVYPNYLLKIDSKFDNNVKVMQQKLIDLGLLKIADGYFGPNTRNAVVSFQNVKKIDADGIVGQVTWNKLFN